MDFKTPGNANLFKIRKVLIEKTEGISILFRSAGAQKFARLVLEEYFKCDLQDRRGKFGSNKKVYEVAVHVPSLIDAADLCEALGFRVYIYQYAHDQPGGNRAPR